MSNRLASVLFSLTLLGATSCSDTPSKAGKYLSNYKAADSKNAEPLKNGTTPNSGTGSENGTGTGGTDPGTGGTDPGTGGTDPGTGGTDPGTGGTDPGTGGTDPGTGGTDPGTGMDPVITYAEVNSKIFKPSCTGCHGGKGNIFTDTYANVKKNLKAIGEAVETNQMPGGISPLKPELKKLLADWIAAGAPEK